MKYKIKEIINDLGITHYKVYKKRWFNLYTETKNQGLGVLFTDKKKAKEHMKLHASNHTKPRVSNTHYNVEVNNDAIKMEKQI